MCPKFSHMKCFTGRSYMCVQQIDDYWRHMTGDDYMQLNIMHTSAKIFRHSVLPQFHLCEFKGVVVSPPCLPVHTISIGGMWPTVVETVEIWIVAIIIPPGTSISLCTVETSYTVIVLVPCGKPWSVVECKRVSCSSTVSWYWQSVFGYWISHTETRVLCITWVSIEVLHINS